MLVLLDVFQDGDAQGIVGTRYWRACLLISLV